MALHYLRLFSITVMMDNLLNKLSYSVEIF
jgi:hypothetical protein